MSKRIAICGIDGAGKSTLVNALYDHYTAIGMTADIARVVFNCKDIMIKAGVNPFADDRTRKIARIGMTFDFIGYYNTLQSSADIILCDRYDVCYRVLNRMDNIGEPLISSLEKMYDTIVDADLYIYCDITAEEAARRLDKRGNRDAGESDIELQRLLGLYSVALSQKKKVIYINASQSADKVFLEAVEKIDNYMRCAND